MGHSIRMYLVFPNRQLTPAAPDPAALRFRLGEGRAQNHLPAKSRVVTAGQVSQPLGC